MSVYISLLKLTPKGAKAVKQSVKRAREFNRAAKQADVTILGQYWTVGAYDGALILGAKKPESALRCIAELVAGGNVTADTLTAYSDKEFQKMVE